MRIMIFLALVMIGLLPAGIVAAEKGNTMVVFSAAQAKELSADPLGGPWTEGPYWTPTLQQISKLESGLQAYLSSNPPMNGDKPVANVMGYGRQYVSVT